jgi:hypothetical protein
MDPDHHVIRSCLVNSLMPFLSVLGLLQISSLVVAIGAFLVLLRQLGLRTMSEKSRVALVVHIRMTSYIMLTGIFLVCLASGAYVTFGILTTSQLPTLPLLLIRSSALFGVICSSVFLHVQAMPMLRQSQGRKIVDSVPARQIIACALAASIAILSWSLWIMSGLRPVELQSIAPWNLLPASAFTISMLWTILTAFLLGERGYRELKAFALFIRKRLTPPTPLERQRMARERRLQHMRLPIAPRRKVAA